ncbi:hypothetical protein H0H81_012116 [Sphagnurus paluster]|uniref:Uncharacterized protein n=1 Tax=Sphagnurus paluster TaxID=117069 RepID=A0A9P7GJK1_9AGAR|nr:hypothetical protein H0H81_012116 [Sphagnurus paluster]
MSAKAMYRWVDIAICGQAEYAPYSEEGRWFDYAIFPVEVEYDLVISTDVHHRGTKALSRFSDDFIRPGDYGLFQPDGSPRTYNLSYAFRKTLYFDIGIDYITKSYPHLTELLFEKPSTSLKTAAMQRDGNDCPFIMGSAQENLQATWVLPLHCEYMVTFISGSLGRSYQLRVQPQTINPFIDRQKFDKLKYQPFNNPEIAAGALKNIHNCIVTSVNAAKLLWSHKLAVDVDDDYRIIYFGVRDTETPEFRRNLVMSADESVRLSDEFLRAHFTQSVRVNIIGGDFRQDYRESLPERFVYSHWDEIDQGRFSDPEVWEDTSIGRAVKYWVIAKAMREAERRPAV